MARPVCIRKPSAPRRSGRALGHFTRMSVAKENKGLLLSCTPEVLDPILVPLGFRRSPRSLVYSRDFPGATHEFVLSFDSSPRYAPQARMHLVPAVSIRMPEVARTALQMTGDQFRFGSSDVIIGHQTQNLAPNSEHRRWFVSDATSCRLALEDIAVFFPRWVEPFLRDYTSPDDLLRQYEAGDKRPIQQHHLFLFVAACYFLRGQRARAAQVLDTHSGKPGLRKIYARAFDSVA